MMGMFKPNDKLQFDNFGMKPNNVECKSCRQGSSPDFSLSNKYEVQFLLLGTKNH
jgi:hypothetical protein